MGVIVMMPLIKFEFVKFFRKPKNLILIFILSIIIGGFILMNLKIDKDITKNKLINISYDIESVENELVKIENEIIRLPDNDTLKNIKRSYEENLDLLKYKESAYISNNLLDVLKAEIKLDQNLLIDIQNGSVLSSDSEAEVSNRIYKNSILLEKEIEPINENFSMESFNFIKLVLNNPIILVIVISILIFTSDIISSESEDKTFNLLLTQPISKNKILISKIISSILISILIIFSILIIAFLILGFTNGLGNLDYPTRFILVNNIKYISLKKFSFYLCINFIVLIIFICNLSVFISSLTKQSSTSISINIVLTTTFYLIINNGLIKKISHLIPFAYINLSGLLQGTLAENFSNINLNFFYSISILLIYSLIIFILNIIIFNKKSDYI